MIKRRKTRIIRVGGVKIGGTSPISIQSMLKIKTANVKKAIEEIKKLERIGCEIIRVAVKDFSDAQAIRQINKKIKIPLVADIHFDYRLGLESIKSGADKIRMNPGNISKLGELTEIIKSAKKRKIPIRIGVNSGSIPRKIRNMKLVDFARKYIKVFEHQNFRDIIISLKSSSVTETIDAHRILADFCDYPFHLGVTAAGPYDTGIVKSSIGIGSLLLDGIGDTVRVSLTGDSREEVIAAKKILQSLRLRNFGPDIISCPTCGRCQVDLIKIVNDLENKLTTYGSTYSPSLEPFRAKSRDGLQLTTKHPMTIAVMGCEVNGPGEAKDADMGIAFGKNSGVLFKKGRIFKKVKVKSALKELLNLILNP